MERAFFYLLEGKELNEEIETKLGKREELVIQGIEDISIEEIKLAVKKLKKEKAVGSDNIENEVWIYASDEVIEELRSLMNNILKGKNMPEEWRKALIRPIFKKGDMHEVRNYRGVSLLNTGYKLFATILNNRIIKWIEREKVIGEWQTGFRKKRGVTDNIYILKKIVEKELKKKKGKIYAYYIDLKAAFDTISREKLWEIMKRKGMDETLVSAVKEIYRKTENSVEVNGKRTDWFVTERGLRQGCPLSPTLFNIYIADLEEYLDNRDGGDIKVHRKRVTCLAYADDIVLIARNVKRLPKIIKSLENYLTEKDWTLNSDKSVIQIFKKGMDKDEKWFWKEEQIKTVRKYTYL